MRRPLSGSGRDPAIVESAVIVVMPSPKPPRPLESRLQTTPENDSIPPLPSLVSQLSSARGGVAPKPGNESESDTTSFRAVWK